MPFIALLTCLFATPQDLRPFAPLDVFQLEAVVGPQVSPDGKRVVYQRRRFDIQEDHGESSLWIIDTDGGNHRPLTAPEIGANSPRWSPDGERLAYLRATEHGVQIFVRWVDTGAELRVTNLPERPGSLAWSPDGDQIAFLARVPKETEAWASMPSPPEGAQWAAKPIIVDRFRYRADGAGYLEPGYRHLFVVQAGGGTPRQLTQGDHDHAGPPAWARDGASLFVSSNRREDREMEPNDTDLYRVPLDGAEAQRITTRYGSDHSPLVSPDGEWLAWLGADEHKLSYQPAQLYVMPLTSPGHLGDGTIRNLTAGFDRSVGAVAWMQEALVFSFDEQGERHLALVPMGGVSMGGDIEDLAVRLQGSSIGRPYTGGGFSATPEGIIAFQQGSSDRPAELGLWQISAEPRVLTDLHSDLAEQIHFAEPQELWVDSSHDKRPIQAWVLYPPDFDPAESYPLILEIHGGPHTAYGPNFSPELQLEAAAGYVVVYANPRGSTSYGAEFSNLIHHNYPSQDYDDLMSVVDAVIAQGSIDSERLFVTGGSGGGVLTAWIVGKTDRFRAAVVAKPVINWLSFALTADAYAYFTQWWFASMPWEDPMSYWERSPLSLVGNVTTPTMLLTGESDYRTPISESEQYYQALKLRGVESAMVRIPGSGHGIASRPSRLLYKVASILAWFEKYDVQDD